ncbi:SCO2522 family protein [Actinoplanes sp. NPDC023801]|uniref:SCO2522 family protein n=1 Tax=Actinoplanes sp. NPDC023801 TaxID=3154595 RepID=UPI0033F911F1
MKASAEFFESTADARVESVPLAHLSVELGHFYSYDLRKDEEFFVEHFRRIGVWYATARSAYEAVNPKGRPRISTCVLIDDYFGKLDPPAVLVPKLLAAANKAGLEIDYLARESGCADTAPAAPDPVDPSEDSRPGLSPAELVVARLVDDPPPNTTGARPPVRQTGWLCNGQRSPATETHEAMKRPTQWRPPAENAAVNHSIFADIELWRDDPGGRLWSCAMLAAVWQLLRLGVLRDNGRQVVRPERLPAELPDDWRALPLVLQVNDRAAPFQSYRTMTICAPLFLPVENAVRTILQQVAVDPAVAGQINQRAGDEGLALPFEVVDRIEYLFVDTGPVRGADPR